MWELLTKPLLRVKNCRIYNFMELTITSATGLVCQAKAERVMLPGVQGRFTILRNHAPIMALLEKGDIIYKTADGEHRVAINSGLADLSHNTLNICVVLAE